MHIYIIPATSPSFHLRRVSIGDLGVPSRSSFVIAPAPSELQANLSSSHIHSRFNTLHRRHRAKQESPSSLPPLLSQAIVTETVRCSVDLSDGVRFDGGHGYSSQP
ncbi:unnamed protein product [Brassica oleracea]|uniref:(rape) hypothetical protein n=1 Tax=Brassica napus TaxID=3708 RepID=A0A816RIQ7_BRANA|nr:unnamed protein product [Brassica napus]